ncbi:dihydromonapterin reductase [Vibrio neptunius]|uniref:Dihydromonapterin reductase n=1 Tax=Vibrio neptunius TaxID=170651 RepID=A0ABS3A5W6_9VIBR|nr:dihydromonapterin reductase [Vibrio neptunius]MBN3494324.1 dihydromonapterin reductase [Vibrio neptunius]MBN3516728.1 dihydromonapterin reductase [Vibrio neptunius]MBN3550996.1 dihydromonapterin reductase [Vibrio neptunius]MBN3579087.1 dihydromonapterin reductase [Vibrio neptunius]MCH9872751.1 dihydromonapterin reductase [Vibrio neptunius]
MKRTVVITGVGKRLGLALAQDFLANEYRVVGTYRTVYPELESLQAQGADLHQVDFYHQQSIDAFIQYLNNEYAQLRCIIHNASDWYPDKPADSSNHAQILQKMMAIHVSAPYQMNLALQGLLNQGPDSSDIIHISDYVAEKGSKKHAAYAASKAALNNLTLSFSAMLAPNIKVNTISPALIKFNQHDDEAYKRKALAKALIPREAGFDEIVEAVRFIMSSKYMTGRNIHLDGGRHLK